MKFEPTLYKLSNGIPVILDPMDLETVNVKIIFKTGGRDETADEKGITHFCEHMFCKGTPRFPTQRSVDDFLDYNAGGKNAFTGNSALCFYGRILGENVNVLIDVLCDQIQNALFADDKIEIERHVISDELRRALDSQTSQLAVFRDKTLFGWDVPNGVPVFGSFENIARFSRTQMREYIARRMSAKNCIVGISGCIKDKDSVLGFLDKALSFLPQIDVSENRDIEYKPAVAHNLKDTNKNVKLRIYFPRLYDSNLENRYKLYSAGKLYRFMLEELYEIIRHENGLVYVFNGVSCGNEIFKLDGFGTQTAPETVGRVVALTAKNAYKMYNESVVTAEVLDRFTNSNRLDHANFMESASKRCEQLVDFYAMYEKIYDFDEVIRLSSSVTPEDVIKYSRGMFDGPMSIITQGQKFDGDLKQIWYDNFK